MAALSLLLSAALAGVASAGIYPDDHWDHATELTAENADEFVKTNVDAGKTVFVRWIASEGCGCCVKQAPAWNKVCKDFTANADVAFGDVALSKNQVRTIHGEDQGAGAGGWPTVRYFNKGTGYGGKGYEKKTSSAMCDELGPKNEYMQQFIEDAGGVSQCSVATPEAGCSDQQKKFIAKWGEKPKDELQKQIDRLSGMVDKDGASMKPDALSWAKQRMNIVKQLHKKEEL